MLKLYGINVSNYFSTAKTALIEKGVPFEEIKVFPSQEPDVIAMNRMGKVPFIEVDGAFLSETNVIFDYLEEIEPQPALYPESVWDRAKARELVRVIENYVDSPARRHIASVYFGAPVNEAILDEVRTAIELGLATLARLSRFSPYIAGSEFGFADITAFFQIGFANLHTQKIYDWDITADVPGLAEYLERVGERESIASVAASMQAGFAAMASA